LVLVHHFSKDASYLIPVLFPILNFLIPLPSLLTSSLPDSLPFPSSTSHSSSLFGKGSERKRTKRNRKGKRSKGERKRKQKKEGN
jgi:hypothetical protein